MSRMFVFAALAIAFGSASACGPKVDVARAVAVESVSSGWIELHAEGKNKIVPGARFRIRNVSDRDLGPLQVNAVFRRVNEKAEWSAGYLGNVAADLTPGAQTDMLTVSAPQGYTGTDSADALLKNSHFVDARMELFVKSGSATWTRISEYQVARQLLIGPPPAH